MEKVRIQSFFENLLQSVEAEPESFLGFSQAEAPTLGDFLADLDPQMSLDWNGVSFQGLPALRVHVIAQAGLEGVCDPDDVLITAGAAEANYLALRQLLEPGDEIIVERPGWPQADVLATSNGAVMREWQRDEASGWSLSLDALEELVTPRTRMIFLTNPNNPTGQLLDADMLGQIVAIAARVGAWVLVDEVYAGLEWDHPRMPAIAGLYERGISTGSVSKAYGMQGLRLGWMICRNAELLRDALVLLGGFIEAHPRLSWCPPQGGLIGLVRLHGDRLTGDRLAARALQPDYRTFLISGSSYGLPQHIRLGVGGGRAANLESGLDRLANLLDSFD